MPTSFQLHVCTKDWEHLYSLFFSIVPRKENLFTPRSTDLRNSVDPRLWCFKRKTATLPGLWLSHFLSVVHRESRIITSQGWCSKQNFSAISGISVEERCFFVVVLLLKNSIFQAKPFASFLQFSNIWAFFSPYHLLESRQFKSLRYTNNC